MSRRAWWGLAAVAAYLVAAGLTFRAGVLPVRPLYEGGAPVAPYRWVKPPPEFAPFGLPPPEAGEGAIELTPEGSKGATIPTNDVQASLIVDLGDIAASTGEDEVLVEVAPLDPASVAAPPARHTFSGNAYRFGARYARSQDPATLAQPLTITLRFAVHATDLWRWGGEQTGWVRLESVSSAASFELFADVEELGIFVTTAPRPGGGGSWTDVAAAAGGVAVTIGGIFYARRRQKKRAAAASRQVRRAQARKRR